MAILLDEEKVVKIVKFNFLVKMKPLLEMALVGILINPIKTLLAVFNTDSVNNAGRRSV
jgi:hypothetical protein